VVQVTNLNPQRYINYETEILRLEPQNDIAIHALEDLGIQKDTKCPIKYFGYDGQWVLIGIPHSGLIAMALGRERAQ
jgi:hypothetical protein